MERANGWRLKKTRIVETDPEKRVGPALVCIRVVAHNDAADCEREEAVAGQQHGKDEDIAVDCSRDPGHSRRGIPRES